METTRNLQDLTYETRNLAGSILDVYDRLRNTSNNQEKMKLLHDAREKADLLASNLQVIAHSANANHLDLACARTLEELGPLMEQILVQEREYRTSVGGGIAADNPPGGA